MKWLNQLRVFALLLTLCVLMLLAGLAGGAQAAACPPGHSYMGCSVQPGPPEFGIGPATPATKIFPDVSVWQGTVDWPAAAPHIAGAAFKLGEGGSSTPDRQAVANITALKRLGKPYFVYWFDRPLPCQVQGPEIVAAAHAVGLTSGIDLDEEVPGIGVEGKNAACLKPYLEEASGGIAPSDYHSAGNVFDTSPAGWLCWAAAYGPLTAPACTTGPLKAWQKTDGTYGLITPIPGIGTGDVSLDYGLLAAMDPAARPPAPASGLQLSNLDATKRTFHVNGHLVRARERNTVKTFTAHHCVRPLEHGKRTGAFVRAVCRSSATHLQLLRDRLLSIHRHGRAWSKPAAPAASGPRNQVLWHLLQGKRRTWSSWRQMVAG